MGVGSHSLAGPDEAGRPGALGNWELFVINADGSDEQQITRSLRNDEYEPDWAPRGGRILVINRTGEAIGDRATAVHSMRTDGSRRKSLTRGSTANDNPEWSPDGRRIVFASARDGNWNIYAMSATGREPTRLTQSPYGTHNKAPTWSP